MLAIEDLYGSAASFDAQHNILHNVMGPLLLTWINFNPSMNK